MTPPATATYSLPLLSPPPQRVGDAILRFRVSLDEEYVEADLTLNGRRFDFGSRVHWATLLCLARARLSDGAHGWLYADDVARALQITEAQLNLHVFRARRQLHRAGLKESGALVERRAMTRQIRLGVHRIAINRVE